MTSRLLLASAFALLVAACGSNERRFDLPLAELKQRVGEVETSPIMLQSRDVGTDREVTGDKVSWKLYFHGEEALRLVATLSADGDAQSRLMLTLEPGARVKAQQAKNPDGVQSITNLYLIAQDEQILSHLEHRELDMGRIMAATMRAAVANQRGIMGQFDRAAESANRNDRANVDRAKEQAGRSN